MKLIVLSDSHNDVENMAAAVLAERPDALLHLGDHIRDAYALGDRYPNLPMFCVSGNNDYMTGESEQTLRLAGKTIFMTHGHHYHVKNGVARLKERAIGLQADIARFGHTHRPEIARFSDLWLFNPGSIGRFLYGGSCSYGVITIEEGAISCKTVHMI